MSYTRATKLDDMIYYMFTIFIVPLVLLDAWLFLFPAWRFCGSCWQGDCEYRLVHVTAISGMTACFCCGLTPGVDY
jgi:hypothetical protein